VAKSTCDSHSKRAVAHAKIITASPHKTKLEETTLEKERKLDVKKRRLEIALDVGAFKV
jgi:hypothetical protein